MTTEMKKVVERVEAETFGDVVFCPHLYRVRHERLEDLDYLRDPCFAYLCPHCDGYHMTYFNKEGEALWVARTLASR